MAGQTLHDRLTAARHTLSGQSVARAVCKSTTEEIIGPKKKHLDYLIHCTNEPNVSVPELCNLLIERTQQSSWVIVFKSLITTHNMMCYGNERFIQSMATSSCKFHLNNFVDKTAAQGYEMSTFVRRYAKYLNVKASTYRTMGADFCKMKRGKDEGVLRNMTTESLLKTLPVLQEQLDALIEFDCNPDDLSNGVMNSCFMLLYRDLIQLFAAYNDGIINLFEKYFSMNKKHCKEALDIYKKFVVAMDKVSDFLKVAESVGIDKGNIPDLTKAPGSLLEEMESHLTYLEGKKGHTSCATARDNSIQTAVSALNNTSAAFTNSITSAPELNGLTIDESMRRAIEEEAAIMNQLKEQKMKEISIRRPTYDAPSSVSKIPSPLPPPSSSTTAPTLSPPTKVKETTSKPVAVSLASDDLLMINTSTVDSNFTIGGQPQPFQQVPFNSYALDGTSNTVTSTGFVSEDSFKAMFNTASESEPTSFDVFGQVLQPQSSVSPTSSSPVPEQCESKSSPSAAKLISTDLDSSLQTLVQNLDINGAKKPLKTSGHQWGSPKPVTRTGGANWSPSSVPMTNYGTPQGPPMAAGAGQFPATGMVGVPAYGYQPAVSGMMPQQPYMVQGAWQSPPAGFGVAQPTMQHPQQLQQQQAPMGMMVQPSPQRMMTQGAPNPGSTAGWPASNDPFGAL